MIWLLRAAAALIFIAAMTLLYVVAYSITYGHLPPVGF